MVPERWQDQISREPVCVIYTWNGTRDDDELGFATWWHDNQPRAVRALLEKIREKREQGFKRFFFNRPQGTPGYTHVGAGSWLTLTEEKRNDLLRDLNDALLDEFGDIELCWFIGSNMHDPRNIEGYAPGLVGQRDFFKLGESGKRDQLLANRQTLGGWLSIGADTIGIDASSSADERAHFVDLFHRLRQAPFELKLWGEAFPLVRDEEGRALRAPNGDRVLDMASVLGMPWLATESFVSGRWERLVVDPEMTRLFVWFDRSNTTREMVTDYMDRGFIPIVRDASLLPEGELR